MATATASEIERKITFNNRRSREFGQAVKKNVYNYFKEKGISKHANAAMVLKTIIILGSYVGAYLLTISGWLTLPQMWLMCVVMGIAYAGIGFSISHDALHGAYSSKPWVNKVLGWTFDAVGANGYMWKITHNMIHHTYTNIHGHDEDLEVAAFIRLSPHSPHKPIHRLQHILAFFAYSFATLFWVFGKDYWYFFKKDLGPYTNKKHPVSEWVTLIVGKVFYYTYALVIPYQVLDITIIQLLIGFVTVHLTAGLILGIIFQLAHVVEETMHPEPDEANHIDNHWILHEMETTNNFARKDKLLCWYIGGLNFQIEHHLFPQICSIHYPEISYIVEETAKEFDIPYNIHETFGEAVASHYRTLKKFGDPNFQYETALA